MNGDFTRITGNDDFSVGERVGVGERKRGLEKRVEVFREAEKSGGVGSKGERVFCGGCCCSCCCGDAADATAIADVVGIGESGARIDHHCCGGGCHVNVRDWKSTTLKMVE